MWWNSLTLPSDEGDVQFDNCQLRRFKESPIGTLIKREMTSKLTKMSLGWT